MKIRFISPQRELKDSEGSFILDYIQEASKPPFENEGYIYATYGSDVARRGVRLSSAIFPSRVAAEEAMRAGITIASDPQPEAFARRCIACRIAALVE